VLIEVAINNEISWRRRRSKTRVARICLRMREEREINEEK
jgi:hypothetical protein